MYVKIDDYKLHYQVVGEGKPVLFLHGLIGISDGMMELFEPIFSKNSGFKRIYLDSPGNGKSDAPDWMNSSDLVLKAIESFIDQVIGKEKFLLVGYSYGGYLSMGLLQKRSFQIEGLTLICPLIEPDLSIRQRSSSELRKVDMTFYKSFDSQVQEDLKSSGVVVLQPSLFQRSEKIYPPAIRVANRQFLNRVKSEGYNYSFDSNNLPSPYEKPTLILTGRQDHDVGYKDAMELDSQFKRATYAVLDAAGHGLPLDQNIIFSTLITEWLDRIMHFNKDMALTQEDH